MRLLSPSSNPSSVTMKAAYHIAMGALAALGLTGNLLAQTYTYDEFGRLRSIRFSDTAVLTQIYADPGVLTGMDADFDSDGDLMPNAFEQQIIDASASDGIATFAQVLPQTDFDGDGVSNFEEFLANTNPADSMVPVIPEPAAATLLLAISAMLLAARRR